MKDVDDKYATPAAAGRRLLELAKENVSPNGWVYVERVNLPFLYRLGAKPSQYGAGIKWLIGEGLIEMHESGAYFTLSDKASNGLALKRDA